MSVELRALDLGSGRAVVRIAERWYLLARNRQWRHVDVGGQERLSAWLFTSSMIPVRRLYATLPELTLRVERVCAAGVTSPQEVARLLDETEESGPDGAVLWLEEMIRRFSSFLDRFFKDRGCSTEESFRLSLEVIQRLDAKRPLRDEDVFPLLCRLASEALPARPGETEPATGKPHERLPELEEARVRRALRGLDSLTGRCLRLWRLHSPEEVAVLLRLSPDDVRQRVLLFASRLGLSMEQLRKVLDPLL